MNTIFTDSWHFLRNNFKAVTLIILPFALFSLITEMVSSNKPDDASGLIIMAAISLLLHPLYIAAVLILIRKLSKKEAINFIEIFSKALKYWSSLFLFSILVGFVFILYLMAASVSLLIPVILVLPTLWLLLRLLLAQLYVVFEGKSTSQAIVSAYQDSKPHLSTFFYSLVPIILLALLYLFIEDSIEAPKGKLLTILEVFAGEYVFAFVSIIQYRLYTLYIKSELIIDDSE